LKAGLSIPGLREKGTYTLSNVQLVKDSQVLLSAKQPTFTVNCLGEILLTGVTSSLMNSQEIKDSGIQLEPGDYVCRRFEMTLSVGGQDVKLKVPVATPVYNGLEDPRGGGESGGGLQIGNIEGGNDLSVSAEGTPPFPRQAIGAMLLAFVREG